MPLSSPAFAHRVRAGALTLVLTLACGGGGGTGAAPAPVLLGRWGHGMAYDTTRHVVLLFGGRGPATAGGAESDQRSLWSFDGATWRRLSSGTGPSARNAFAMAFDAKRQRVVVFGGRTGTAPTGPAFNDTFEWDGSAWSPSFVSPTGPPAREHVAGGYDPVRQAVAIVGGFSPSSAADLHDQWEWSGGAWAQLSGSVPNLGFAPSLASSGTKLTLFQSRTSDRAVQVLEASGAGQWTAVTPVGTVPALTAYATAQLPGGGILLFGGSDGVNTLGDSWKWDGASFTKLAISGPPARLSAAMALDSKRGKVVLYGGQNAAGAALADTWEFDGAAWTRIVP
jgi:hypothetical protein